MCFTKNLPPQPPPPPPPPADKPHNHHFQVSALDVARLDLPSGFNRQALLNAMKGHVIIKCEIVGMYQRRPDVREKKLNNEATDEHR